MNVIMIFCLLFQGFHLLLEVLTGSLGYIFLPIIMSVLLFFIFQLKILYWLFQNQISDLCGRQKMVSDFN